MFSTAETVSPLTQTLLNVLPHSAMIINRDRKILSANSKAIEAGAEVGEPCWKTFSHAAHLSDEHKMLSRGESPTAGISCTFCRADQCLDSHSQENDPAVQSFGGTLDVYWVAINTDLYLHYAIDVTEHAETKALLRCVLDSAEDLIYFKDRNSTYIGCNKASEKFTGIAEREQIGKTDFDFFDPEIAELIVKDDQKVIESHTPVRTEEWVPSPVFGKVLLETVKTPIYGPDGQSLGLVGISRDITERKKAEEQRQKLEEQLLQTQKIESIGQLAGGVAHDFNNMLGVILGHTELALMKADHSSPFTSDLQEIRTAATRSADLTRQLLTFARKQVIAPQILDLNEAVSGTLKMLQRLIGENIQLLWNPAANLWPTKVDPSQLDQILANLCVNARDAISATGKISIKTANTPWDEDDIASLPYDVVPGDYVQLSVSDDGCGMDKNAQAHIFEPFYTTKEVGSGTGLGLATVYGAVKQNHGFFTIDSEPGLGTVFNIFFPRTSKAVEAKQETAEKQLLRGNETILLVEDEEMLLAMETSMLKESGYTVLSAITTDHAQFLAKEHPGPIDLLVSDMIMPVMNGKELSDKLQTLQPEMKVLFLSGYTADIISNQGGIEDQANFLQKPFSLEALTAKVREVLDDH